MEIKAKLNNLRIAPRKVRLVADLVRGRNVNEANELLGFCVKRGALPLRKLLQSCLQNSKHNFQVKDNNLFIKEVRVDEGVKLKRWHPMSRGRAGAIQKKTSHITLTLGVSTQINEKSLKAPSSLGEEKEAKLSEKGKKKNKEIRKKQRQAFNSFNEGKKGANKANLKKVFRRKAI